MLFDLFRFFKFYLIFALFQTGAVFAQNPISIKFWVDDSGEHSLVIEKEISKINQESICQ